MISIASVISTVISYVVIPTEMHLSNKIKSLLTLYIYGFPETSRLYVKSYMAFEYFITIQYLKSTTQNLKIRTFLHKQLYITIPLIGISIISNDKAIPFRLIYIYIETPIILYSCANKIVDILHDFKVNNLSTNADFFAHYGILFLFGTSLPLTFILYYKINESANTLFVFNILNSIIYSIYYSFIIKATKWSIQT